MIPSLTITFRFTLLAILALVITLYGLGLGLASSYDVALADKKAQIKAMTDAGVTLTENFVAQAANGSMTTAQAQAAAKRAVGAIRYDGNNFLIATTYDGVSLVHPIQSFLGKNIYGKRDSHGTLVVAPLIDAARAGAPIFNQYYAPRPGQAGEFPKISYGRAVPEWGWVISTGLFTDDLQNAFAARLIGLAEIFLPIFAIFLVIVYVLRRAVSALLRQVEGSMSQIAQGALDTPIPGLLRGDELGHMARALAAFRDAARERLALEATAAAGRAAAETERARAQAEHAAAAAAQSRVVETLAAGLHALAGGDLTHRIATPFAAAYENLRTDFNAAMGTLQTTMQAIATLTGGLADGAKEITAASDDLSRRTEHQAATLQETASALDQITATLNRAAARAGTARDAATTAAAEAAQSGAVVSETVAAMSGIEGSSKQIGSIIGVIDEIAFQTNLLALNAGVEAARAGDAGRGFAVVATEVRALAQRSADAAKEIKALIAASGGQVAQGVRLVGQAGTALERIAGKVMELNALVTEIAASAAEQSASVREVNGAMSQMDQVTQQNAAMVEESTAASHGLSGQAAELARLIGQFRVEDAGLPGRFARVAALAG
jgi:methyl-accepting chemotaxis protein